MRKKIVLICSECLSRNYTTTSKESDNVRFEIKKFCKRCNKQTLHKQSK